jgi:tetratricopeptide (TPR) repeat protein
MGKLISVVAFWGGTDTLVKVCCRPAGWLLYKKALRYNLAQCKGGTFVGLPSLRNCYALTMQKSPRFAVCLLSLLLTSALAGKAWADDFSEVAQLSREGKFVEALAKAEVYLSSRPKDAQMRLLKGLVQRDAGKPADAISTFTRMNEDFPELPEPYNNLGVIYADQNQLDKARTAFEMALRTNPSYSTAHENLADVYGRLSSAAYNKALQIDLSNAAVAPKLALVRQIITLNPTKLSAAQLAAPPKVQPAPAAPATQVAIAATKASPEPAPKAAPLPETAVKPTREPATAARKPVDDSSPTTAKSATTKAAPAPLVDTTANREVEQAVQRWATAWSDKDLKAYFAAYGRDFDPAGKQSRNAWEEERRARIEGKANISIQITDLQTLVRGNTALVKFRQNYRANSIAISSRKTLEMVRQGDNWKIVREAVGG